MVVPDVNVLLYAFREELPEYSKARKWLTDTLEGDEPMGLPDVVSSAFIRISTHPRTYTPPTPVDIALDFIETLLSRPNCIRAQPGPRHWGIFAHLCRSLRLRGVLIPDAYLAAIAIETASEFITSDKDFARFPGLRWRNPLD
jgi:toxin-antitoxin system PIN domain toxin